MANMPHALFQVCMHSPDQPDHDLVVLWDGPPTEDQLQFLGLDKELLPALMQGQRVATQHFEYRIEPITYGERLMTMKMDWPQPGFPYVCQTPVSIKSDKQIQKMFGDHLTIIRTKGTRDWGFKTREACDKFKRLMKV